MCYTESEVYGEKDRKDGSNQMAFCYGASYQNVSGQATGTFGTKWQSAYALPAFVENPGMTQDRFITSFYINPSNITRSLAYLEREGFIRKENNKKDKRTCCLYPTQKWEMVYHEIVKICRQ